MRIDFAAALEAVFYLVAFCLLLLTLCNTLASLGLKHSAQAGVPSNADLRFFVRVYDGTRTGIVVCASILAGILVSASAPILL